VLTNDSHADSVVSFKVKGDTTVYSAGQTATIAGKGLLTLDGNGDYTFTPAPDYSGPVPQVTCVTDTGWRATLDITITPVADAPHITVTLGGLVLPGNSNTPLIHTGTVLSTNQGFKVEAYNTDGSLGTISRVNSWNPASTAVNGFGVEGVASGDSRELGFNRATGQSEMIKVTFAAPVASATVTFAWLGLTESARYIAYGEDGSIITQGITKGLSDTDTPLRKVVIADSAAIKWIEFTAVGNDISISPNGDDYLIHSIEFVTAATDSNRLPVAIAVKPGDPDGSESITQIVVTIAGSPLSVPGGTDNGNGTWTYTFTESGAPGGGYTWSVNTTNGEVTIKDGGGHNLSISAAADHPGGIMVHVAATVVDHAVVGSGVLEDTRVFTSAELTTLLIGTPGDDVLVGGKGSQILQGGSGNDIYVFAKGDGQDTINDNQGSNSIRFLDVKSDEIKLVKSGNDLRFFYGDSDALTIENHFADTSYQMDNYEFVDVTLIGVDLLAMYGM
jgi:hypothetical protein